MDCDLPIHWIHWYAAAFTAGDKVSLTCSYVWKDCAGEYKTQSLPDQLYLPYNATEVGINARRVDVKTSIIAIYSKASCSVNLLERNIELHHDAQGTH